MTQFWLVPVDEPSFQATLDTPIDLREQAQKPDEFPDYTRVWGVRMDPEQGDWERNRRNLDRMEPGDPLVIYRNETSEYHATGRVGPFWHTEYVRDEYWNGGPALEVFAVEGYTAIDVSRDAVNRTLGYEEQFWPQDSGGSQRTARRIGSSGNSTSDGVRFGHPATERVNEHHFEATGRYTRHDHSRDRSPRYLSEADGGYVPG